MEKFVSLVAAAFISMGSLAQTRDLVVFTDDGLKFTLIVDGEVKNAAPASRVVATGIRNETPMCMVRFEDSKMADVKQSLWLVAGKEYTVVITTNKKGLRVFRPQGEAELGTAKAEPKPDPSGFVDDKPRATQVEGTTMSQDVNVGGVQQTTTTTVVETDGDDGDDIGTGENVNINMGVNGMGINMNVGVTETGGSSTGTTTTRTNTTHTTTTTSSSGTMAVPAPSPKPAPVAEPYRMPGYTGPIGCAMPMSPSEFSEAKASIESKGFEETKMTLAKQITGTHCLSSDQVKGIMGVFGFEETKLEFAKFAYDHTHDIGNYYKVNDAFGFESSIEELNNYIKSH